MQDQDDYENAGTRAAAMGPALQRRIEERAYELWRADGMRYGRELDYWLQAEQEIMNQSVAGEEDPLAGIDQDMPEHG